MAPVAGYIASEAFVGLVATAAVSYGSQTMINKKSEKKAKAAASSAREHSDEQAKKQAKALKEANANRSSLFDTKDAGSQKSLLDAQKKKRREVSGAQGTRLTGGKLGSPAVAGGATLLGQ